MQMMSNLHTIQTHINVSFGDVMYFGLRGKSIRSWEGKYKSYEYDHIKIVWIEFYLSYNIPSLQYLALEKVFVTCLGSMSMTLPFSLFSLHDTTGGCRNPSNIQQT